MRKLSIEDDYCWYVYEVLGNDDRSSHKDFEKLFFNPTRGVEGEPRCIEKRAADSDQQCTIQRLMFLTSFPKASYGTQSKEGSPDPSIADRRSTILISAAVK